MKLYLYAKNKPIPLMVRLIETGDRYGLGVRHEGAEPMVEFFDPRYPHSPYGQFTGGRYYLSTFMSVTGGLNLYGGVREWTADIATVENLKIRLRGL